MGTGRWVRVDAYIRVHVARQRLMARTAMRAKAIVGALEEVKAIVGEVVVLLHL